MASYQARRERDGRPHPAREERAQHHADRTACSTSMPSATSTTALIGRQRSRWKDFVADFNAKLPFKARGADINKQNPVMGTRNLANADQDSTQEQAKWEARMKIKERTVSCIRMVTLKRINDKT